MVGNGDLEIRTLLVSLEAQNVLPHRHLHGVYNGGVGAEVFVALTLQIVLERVAVIFLEAKRGSNVKVVKETCDVEENGMTILQVQRVSQDNVAVKKECVPR